MPPAVAWPNDVLSCTVRPGRGSPLPSRTVMSKKIFDVPSAGANQRRGARLMMGALLSGKGALAVVVSTGWKNTPAVTLEPSPGGQAATSDCGPLGAPHQLLVACTGRCGV